MRVLLGVTAAAAAGIGFAAGRVRPAQAIDEHANHVVLPVAQTAETQQAPVIPPSSATAKDRLDKTPRHGEWVAIKYGTDSVMAWVVYPERRDKAPAVIAIHENTGINTWTRSVADQLAADGFIGIAPDLTTMFRTSDLKQDPAQDEGRAGIQKVTADLGNAALAAVEKYAASLPASTGKVGVMGFCWGGARSFLYAAHSPTIAAAIVWYGSPPAAEQMAKIKAPVQGYYGGNDARINATIPATDSTMKALGKKYSYEIFDGAGHGFVRAQDAGAQPNLANLTATQNAWPKAIAFLRANLK